MYIAVIKQPDVELCYRFSMLRIKRFMKNFILTQFRETLNKKERPNLVVNISFSVQEDMKNDINAILISSWTSHHMLRKIRHLC
jgi:hypothetical protein